MREIIVPTTLRERLQELRGRRRDLWMLAVVVALVVLGAIALWSRGTSARIAPPAVAAAPSSAETLSQTTTPAPVAEPTPQALLVHVAGAVRRPGLYELALGARVADAIKAAGGPLRKGELDALNLAEALTDGGKIEVPTRSDAVASAPVAVPSPSPSVAVVNVNTADQIALETIPGVGPVTAAAILEYRAGIGAFSSVEELLEVSGIGPATLESIRSYVTI